MSSAGAHRRLAFGCRTLLAATASDSRAFYSWRGFQEKKISCRLATDRCEQQQTRAVTSNGPFPRKTRTPDHSPRSDLSRQGGPHFVPLLQSEGLGASAILTPPGALETDPAPFPGFEYVEYCQWIVVAKQYASTTACFSKCPTQCT